MRNLLCVSIPPHRILNSTPFVQASPHPPQLIYLALHPVRLGLALLLLAVTALFECSPWNSEYANLPEMHNQCVVSPPSLGGEAELSCLPRPVGVGEGLVVWRG